MVPEESEEEDSSTENGTWKSLPILPLLLTLCIIYFIQFILGLIHFSLWDGWLVLLCPTFLPLALFLITGNHIRLLSLHLRSSGGATTTPPPLLHPQSLFYAYLLSYVLCLFSNTTLLLFSVLIVLKSMTWGAGGGLQDNGGTTFFVWEVTVGAMGMGLGVQVAILCVLWVAWGREQKRGSLSRASGRGIGYGAV